jgi:diaminopimelate epimerase
MRFFKAHAYGNDFLYVEQPTLEMGQAPQLAQRLCDRHRGIGADGLILFEQNPGGPVRMRLFNADGSPAEISGNGVRGLGALILRNDHRASVPITIETDAGPKRLTRIGRSGARQLFRAAMGSPTELRRVTISVDDDELGAVVLNMGNPQCVLLGPLPDEAQFNRLGRALEHHPTFPEGTNIEFVRVASPDNLEILIWERGVGPSLSSGTGSCAALIAAAAYGGAARVADVTAPGGSQRVEWCEDDVYLTGWAEVLFDGEWLV